MNGLMQHIHEGERIAVHGDLNGHVGKSNMGHERVHEEFSYGDRNLIGDPIFEFALIYDLAIANTHFKKRNGIQ